MRILQGGKVLTMAGPIHDPGRIFIRDGKIVAIGGHADLPLPPAEEGWEVVDLAGKWLIPGLIDAHTHVGISEQGMGREGMDVNETTDPVTPHLRALDATNPEDWGVPDALGAGITVINVMPGSANVIGGLAVALKTVGTRIDQMMLRIAFGAEGGDGREPQEDLRRPEADAGHPAGHRRAAARAIRAGAELSGEAGAREPGKPFERDLRLEALGMVLRHEIPMRIHAHRADDILTALRIRDEFGFDMVLDHSTEAFKIADELTRRNIPAVLGPLLTSRYKVELRERNLRSAARLVQAGRQGGADHRPLGGADPAPAAGPDPVGQRRAGSRRRAGAGDEEPGGDAGHRRPGGHAGEREKTPISPSSAATPRPDEPGRAGLGQRRTGLSIPGRALTLPRSHAILVLGSASLQGERKDDSKAKAWRLWLCY